MGAKTSIEVDAETAERARLAAEATGLTVGDLVERAMEAWLDDWAEDLRRLDEPGEDVAADVALETFRRRVAEGVGPAK
ncbi:MAG: hypothetical protein GC199_03895 [Alphaproteobacteria bacterium]|nr:hypothetical protein [Alphaproteobacteria bacterium]